MTRLGCRYAVKPPHQCATCNNIVEGRTVYCESCRHDRALIFDAGYKRQNRYKDPCETSPQTNLDWLKAFGPILAGTRQTEDSYGKRTAKQVTV